MGIGVGSAGATRWKCGCPGPYAASYSPPTPAIKVDALYREEGTRTNRSSASSVTHKARFLPRRPNEVVVLEKLPASGVCPPTPTSIGSDRLGMADYGAVRAFIRLHADLGLKGQKFTNNRSLGPDATTAEIGLRSTALDVGIRPGCAAAAARTE